MVDTNYVYKILNKTKRDINKNIQKQKYENALSLISLCASFLYQTNIYYQDDDLEEATEILSKELELNQFYSEEDYSADDDCLLFYDGFGVNDRGLIQIYLKALCKVKRVVYVTYEDRKELIPDVQNILDGYKYERKYINRRKKSYIEQIDQLNEIVKAYRPKRFFFYSLPYDVVATPIMFSYGKYMTRYQINLTDHAYWLGTNCIDKCIEFRNYGAKISNEYRKIAKEKIVIIPFYPIIHREREFQGFPFEKRDDQKVIFSGGALYKTLGGDNKYYKIVDLILQKHEDTIFWYAGSGDDSELKKILTKYPNRAFHTQERGDLLQVLEHSDVYLSTYPMCGGLMFQYAAMAGTVPVTLKSGNISDEFLINQDSINIEFKELSPLLEEVDRLLDEKEYASARSKLMKESVISETVFDEEVRKLICDENGSVFPPNFEHIDTDEFRAWYLEGLNRSDIDAMFVTRNGIKLGVTHYPLRFFRGGVRILQRRCF